MSIWSIERFVADARSCGGLEKRTQDLEHTLDRLEKLARARAQSPARSGAARVTVLGLRTVKANVPSRPVEFPEFHTSEEER
jgi:hypothetical protein